MTSPVCPVYVVTCWPVSISHKALKHNLVQLRSLQCKIVFKYQKKLKYFNIIYLPGHIATACNNLVIIEEPTATEVASVSRKFPADPNIAFASFQATNQKSKVVNFNWVLSLYVGYKLPIILSVNQSVFIFSRSLSILVGIVCILFTQRIEI